MEPLRVNVTLVVRATRIPDAENHLRGSRKVLWVVRNRRVTEDPHSTKRFRKVLVQQVVLSSQVPQGLVYNKLSMGKHRQVLLRRLRHKQEHQSSIVLRGH